MGESEMPESLDYIPRQTQVQVWDGNPQDFRNFENTTFNFENIIYI